MSPNWQNPALENPSSNASGVASDFVGVEVISDCGKTTRPFEIRGERSSPTRADKNEPQHSPCNRHIIALWAMMAVLCVGLVVVALHPWEKDAVRSTVATPIKGGSADPMSSSEDPILSMFGSATRFQDQGQFGWTEGPIWHPGHKVFYFSDVPNAKLWTFDPATDKFELFVDDAGSNPPADTWKAEPGSNGLALSPTDDNILFVSQHGARRIAKLDLTTRQFTSVVDNYEGFKLNSPNDLIFTSDNKFYFTDPPFGLMVREGETSPLYASTSFGDGWWLDATSETGVKGVYSVDLTEASPRATLLTGGITRPNGICVDTEGDGSFYIAETATPLALPTSEGRIYKLDSKGEQTGYFTWPSEIPADGVECTNMSGQLRLLTTHDKGMVVLDPTDGTILGFVETEARISNIAIGSDYALLTGLNGVWKVPINL